MCITTCKPETPVDGRAVIEEKLRSLTAEELLDHALKICLENQELRARCDYQERELKNMASDRERAYLNGKIDGLMFSIRCNGVSCDAANCQRSKRHDIIGAFPFLTALLI